MEWIVIFPAMPTLPEGCDQKPTIGKQPTQPGLCPNEQVLVVHCVQPFTHSLLGGVVSNIKSKIVGTHPDNRMVLYHPDCKLVQDKTGISRSLVTLQQPSRERGI